MRIVVVGAGEVGTYVAQILSEEGNTVSMVEVDEKKLHHISEELDVLVVQGSGSHPHILREAGISKADLLVAVTASDEVNLLACLLARQHGVERTIARIQAHSLREKNARELREAMQVDTIIDPDEETAREIIDLLSNPGATDVTVMANGEVIVVGVQLAPDAPWVNRRLAEIAAESEPDWDFLVAVLTRNGETQIPRADTTLEPEDVLRVVCKRRARSTLLPLLGLAAGTHRRVMLLGGGRTAEILARCLSEQHAEVVLIENSLERAQALSEELDAVLVLQGDITDAELLESEEVGKFDAVIALTGKDDANILACLYAKSLGASETIAVLHNLALRTLLQDVGIDVALSPRTVSANGVLRYVRGGVTQVATNLSGEFEIIEAEVKTGSSADGATISKLGLPKDVLIGAYVRDGKAQIGRGRSQLRGRDHIIVFARPDTIDEMMRFFG
ncbi:MAG: Trk system potassium transporter TrkA [Acidimicrobiia bacterium]|nr:Trk system potassium transporter TrkA [Acidimicrobiia bacterium]MYC58513.1 Trk system potassium transporter TrkA [Acidimicrobiia bacterium]MYI30381.1 Trk system potassium transporter TrkA [Acidimicrobiia bacterium]